MRSVDLRYIYVLVATLNLAENKRYDMEEQCNLEYGMDLKGVLRQFRRSSDYLNILEMRAKEFDVFFKDVMYQSLDWNQEKMKQKIAADFGLNQTYGTTSRATPAQTTNASLSQRTRFLRSKLSGRRDDANPQQYEEHEKTLDKINRIDEYSKMKSYLTVNERNHYKDMGFEYAGDVIHSVIHAMGGSLMGDTTTSGSTRLTLPGQTSLSTTEHMLKHIPTTRPSFGPGPTKIGPTKRSNRYVLVSRYYPKIIGK